MSRFDGVAGRPLLLLEAWNGDRPDVCGGDDAPRARVRHPDLHRRHWRRDSSFDPCIGDMARRGKVGSACVGAEAII